MEVIDSLDTDINTPIVTPNKNDKANSSVLESVAKEIVVEGEIGMIDSKMDSDEDTAAEFFDSYSFHSFIGLKIFLSPSNAIRMWMVMIFQSREQNTKVVRRLLLILMKH